MASTHPGWQCQASPGGGGSTWRAASQCLGWQAHGLVRYGTPPLAPHRSNCKNRLLGSGSTIRWPLLQVLTGCGPMAQLSSELQVPLGWATGATAALAVAQLVLGLSPGGSLQTLASCCSGSDSLLSAWGACTCMLFFYSVQMYAVRAEVLSSARCTLLAFKSLIRESSRSQSINLQWGELCEES
jgi:hypothetical protein